VGTIAELEQPEHDPGLRLRQDDSDVLYIVMEFVLGRTRRHAREGGGHGSTRVEKIMAQVCGSLEEAHGAGSSTAT